MCLKLIKEIKLNENLVEIFPNTLDINTEFDLTKFKSFL